MEVHFLSDNTRKHSTRFTWKLCIGAKRGKKPIKIKCLLRAKIAKPGFKTIVFLINQYWNLKVSTLKMTEKEIPDFINSFRRWRENRTDFHNQPHRNSCIKEQAQKHTGKHRPDLGSPRFSKKTSLLRLSQENVTYLNSKCILQSFECSWVLSKVLTQVLMSLNQPTQEVLVSHLMRHQRVLMMVPNTLQ